MRKNDNSTSLLSADGKKGFYEKFGFKEKKEVVDAGMYMWLKKEE